MTPRPGSAAPRNIRNTIPNYNTKYEQFKGPRLLGWQHNAIPQKSDQTLHQGGYTPTLLDTPIHLNKPNTAQARLLAHNEIATIGDTYTTPP
jgi:hypothetical protein